MAENFGTGLHAIELASRGYKITGLDTSPDMIAVARGKKSDVAFVCGAIGEVHGIGPFDACISLYNVINCVEGLERLCEFFISVSSVLYPKARFICECWNPVAIIQSPPTRVVRKYDSQLGEITRSAVPTWDFMKQALQIDYDIEVVPRSRPGDVSKFSVSHPIRLFTPMEIEFALTRAGFEMVEVCRAKKDDGSCCGCRECTIIQGDD